MSWKLQTHERFRGAKGPVVLVVLDGVGRGAGDESDAVKIAATPVLDSMWAPGVRCELAAHGTAVGLPSDADMGNSEVGHNALGAGRVYDQGAKLVGQSIASKRIFSGAAWLKMVARCIEHSSAMHFVGLLSDGNVHSHIDHLIALLRAAAAAGVRKLYVHPLTDGRDVGSQTSLEYIDKLEAVLAELQASGCDAAIASGGGRMVVTMDRYDADWSMVERGWKAHVLGEAPHRFASAREAVLSFREQDSEISDQLLPPFVIERDGAALAPIVDGDCVININFRGDRALELSRAFEAPADDFDVFDRVRHPEVLYAGIMEYDGDLHVPANFLVEPPVIDRPMGEYLVHNQVSQLAISETQKFGHVTYFWNGNRSGKFDDDLETYIEIRSDVIPFDQRPWMKAAEITDRLISELRTGRHRFVRVNYANGDMVGHTGSFDATVVAVQVLDLQLARLRKVVDQLDGILVVTADHGNADEMYMHGKNGRIIRDGAKGIPVVKTSHTLNPVPLMIYDAKRGDQYKIDPAVAEVAGIASVTATCLDLLGFRSPDGLAPSLLRFA